MKIKGKLKSIRNKAVRRVYKILFLLMSKLPVKKGTVIFESFHGKQFSCNPRAIYEYMIEHCPEYNLIWSVNKAYKKQFEDRGIHYIDRLSIKWLFKMARAEYWVINSRLPLWIPKPAHTTYIQTWHGTPLKRLAMDMDEVLMPGTNTESYKKNFVKEASNWDYLISPNQYSSEIFIRAFRFNKKLLETGYPRNDILYQENNLSYIKNIKNKLNIPLTKKVILYAPTWRDNKFYRKGRYKFDLHLDLDMLKEALSDEYVIILRMHYLVAENFDLEKYKGFVIDCSLYEDIRDLYLISDLLITDYSSVFFDYANLKRPMLFFVPDLEDYRDNLRGFYFDFEKEAPGPLLKITQEVIDQIKSLNEIPKNNSVLESFYEKFCYLENGNSTKKVVEKIFNLDL